MAWSPEEKAIVSGGVDKKVILYTLNIPASGDVSSLSIDKEVLGSHKHLVQGVAWDPKGEFVASLSNDRSFHVYKVNKKTRIANISKVGKVHLFQVWITWCLFYLSSLFRNYGYGCKPSFVTLI